MIEQRSLRLLAIVVLSAIVVFALLVLLSQISGSEGGIQELLADVPQDGTTLGSEDAPVTIYLYEDLQCPACASFARRTFPDLVTRYVEPGEVKVVSEPLKIIGPRIRSPPPRPPSQLASKTSTGNTPRCSF